MADAEKPYRVSTLKLEIMKKVNLLSGLFLAAVVLFTACEKDEKGTRNIASNAQEFTQKFGAQTQSFKINVSELPQTLSLKGGTKITFPVGSLTQNGMPVTGEVTVEAMEMLKRSDVLFSGTNTNHVSGAPLQSDGFIFIDVKANGQSVDKNLAKPVNIKIPAKRDGGTQLWEGVQNDEKQMAWQAPRPANGAGQVDVKAQNNEFAFNFGTLGWINCDVFWNYSNPKTTVRVEVLNNPGTMATFRGYSGDTFVFFCAKGSNVAAQLYTPDGANKVKSYDDMMPVGAEGRLFSFSIKDGKYYLAKKDITITANQNETLSLVETTESNIQAEINALNNY